MDTWRVNAAGAVRGEQAGVPAVQYERVSFAYPGPPGEPPRLALENVSLTVQAGERLGILGPNGGGKSTLLKLTLGVLTGYRGTIRVFGLPPRAARRERLLGYVPQRLGAELAFPLSVHQVVAMPATLALRPWARLPQEARRAIRETMTLVEIDALADVPIGRLSGGQLQRVMIARALAARPRVLLLDEPTVGIDIVGQQRFADLLHSLHVKLGLTIIVVSHDIRTIIAGCDRIACLSRTLHSHVDPRGLTPQVLAEVFRHDVTETLSHLRPRHVWRETGPPKPRTPADTPAAETSPQELP